MICCFCICSVLDGPFHVRMHTVEPCREPKIEVCPSKGGKLYWVVPRVICYNACGVSISINIEILTMIQKPYDWTLLGDCMHTQAEEVMTCPTLGLLSASGELRNNWDMK